MVRAGESSPRGCLCWPRLPTQMRRGPHSGLAKVLLEPGLLNLSGALKQGRGGGRERDREEGREGGKETEGEREAERSS